LKHIVGFSGGIDSQEALARVRAQFGDADVIAVNSDAGKWEQPLTVAFVELFSETVFPVVHVEALVSDMWEDESDRPEFYGLDRNAVLTFEDMVRIKKRSPSRKMQFCTTILKLKPQRRWTRFMFGPSGPFAGQDFERYTGVRRDESEARKNYPDREWDDFFDCWVNHPIAGLTKDECFAGAASRGEPINPLYLMGFGRVGCAPCINSSKEDILNWLARAPEMIDKIRGLEARTGRTFFAPMVPGLPMNNIEQVITWARTSFGGRQQLFPILHEREGCESKYGLCE
jgi:3'-phosphoadenosine 5'-phosphosulfate sulfotransferase (PAPS reductase)/FAD synthetase